MRVEKALYFDPQQVPAVFACPVCGGCVYLPSLRCIRCERGWGNDSEGDE